MENIDKLTEVPEWPPRKDSQENFNRKIEIAMNRMTSMITMLNSDFIPKINELRKKLEDSKKVSVMYVKESSD